MPYLNSIFDALRTVIAPIWPDAAANGLYEGEHADMIPWADLTPPYGALLLGELVDTDDWDVTSHSYEGDLEVYYVAEVSGDGAPIRAKLEALREVLEDADLAVGQIINVTGQSWSDTLPANEVLISKGYTHRAGMLKMRFLVGETNV